MYKTSLGSVTAEIEELLVEKLSAKGRNLNQKLGHAGRSLPKKIRVQAAYLAEAETRYQNPKLAHQYDAKRVLAVRKQCVDHLEKIDPRARRSRRIVNFCACVVVNFFVLGIGIFAFSSLMA